jgi:hypothetical protein
MLKNKLLIFLSFILFCAPIQAKEWDFDIYLGNKIIGTHTFNLENGMLKSDGNFKIKALFINLYQYQYTATEQWKDDCLTALQAQTKEDGNTFNVSGKADTKSFNVSFQGKTQTLSGCTMSLAYWNPMILTQKKLLNPQNAEYLDTEITKIGIETINVKGRPTMTTHYKIFGFLKERPKLKIDLWYDQQQNWVEMKSITPENYELIYKLK